METVTKNLTKNIYNWFVKDDNNNSIKQLSDNTVLNIANNINSIFIDTNLIENKPELTLPRLVVVGSQSSGKSSVLNAVITMDILPTGSGIVTRTPLEMRLHKIDKNSPSFVEFGHYDNGKWIKDIKINITVPSPTPDEIARIRTFIQKRTIELAGDEMNISSDPIILDIYSPFVPNLSLIDLPGLTLNAKVDKGQPKDIQQRIENLALSYIKQDRTIILAVMQSNIDPENDHGLSLINSYPLAKERAIGVLTKPDLMNSENHVGDRLNNDISKNLALNYGYYVVRNRSNKQMTDLDMFGGFDMENNYFSTHLEYTKEIYKNKVGMKNLTNSLSKILISSINELLPSVISEIASIETKINKKLDILGDDLPETKEGKISVLNRYVSNFNTEFINSTESRGTSVNTGKEIKDIFNEYKNTLEKIKPFTQLSVYNEEYFKNVVASFEGNHMSSYTSPIKILEACMLDKKINPVFKMKETSLKCVDDICNSLINLVKEIAKDDQFAKYPELASYIISSIVDKTVSTIKVQAKNRIIDDLKDEGSYTWTDDPKFKENLNKITKIEFNINDTKNLLDSYYSSIKFVVAHRVPKIIMRTIIRDIQENLLGYLIGEVVNEDKINLLKEDNETDKQRKYYRNIKNRIIDVKKLITKN